MVDDVAARAGGEWAENKGRVRRGLLGVWAGHGCVANCGRPGCMGEHPVLCRVQEMDVSAARLLYYLWFYSSWSNHIIRL